MKNAERFLTTALALACAVALAACAHSEAKARVEPLKPPPVPDRPVPPPAQPETPDEPGADVSAPRQSPPPRSGSRGEASRPAAPAPVKTEPAPPAPAAPPRVEPAPLLTPHTADERESEKRARDRLALASQILGRVDYQALSREARTQYETAKSFIAQAEEATRARNYLFAQRLADKAVALAEELARR